MHKQCPAWARLPLVSCACADGSSCRGHTPWQSKQLQLSVQRQRSRSAWTLLPDYWQVWTDLASRFARGSVASASACLAGLSKRAALSRQTFDNASLAVAMARGIKATLLCAHGPTIFWSILSLVVWTFSPPAPRVHSNRALPRRVSMPSCNDTDYIRKLSLWKIFFVVYI